MLTPARPRPVAAASMVVCANPLLPPLMGRPIVAGTPLRELAPPAAGPLMLRVNGQWLLRAQWGRPAMPGDVIEWHQIPMGRGGSRAVLTIIAVIAIATFAPQIAATLGVTSKLGVALVQAGLTVAATALINALIPIQPPSLGGGGASPSSVYNVALSANQARLSQPIPVIYGRMLTFPDYAGQPYSEFIDGDQYFLAVFCIGQGEYEVERLQIDDTPLSHFADVAYEILAPGELPTLALASVVSAPEVAGQDMLTGVRIGGFAACSPRYLAQRIGVDVVFPRGLGLADNSGNIGSLSATFQVDARPIDDFGTPTGAWYTLGVETVTRASSEPVRLSFTYTLAAPARVEVRMMRTDVRNNSIRALHDVSWAGLRAYLSVDATLAPTATHMAVKIRASEQLSGLSQRKISGVWVRKLRTWSAEDGWGPLVATRNPMWARLDKLTSTVYGDGLPDERIDLETHAELAALCDERQDRLDILFDSRVTSLEADRTICSVCRAVPFQRAGVCTVARDSLQTLPVTAYTSRDILPGSMTIGYALATEVTADGVIVEYFDNRAWEWRDILCPAPGVSEPVRAVRQRLLGITGAIHAEREGLYLAAQNVYRRKFPTFSTELQGLLPAYGSAVMFAPALPGWGQAGDVVDWDADTLTLTVSEPLAWTAGANHYVSISRDDGSVTPAIVATPGADATEVVLAEAPLLADGVTPMTITVDDATRERPKFAFGVEGEHRIMVRVLGIRRQGRQRDGAPTIELRTVAEDVRVHAVDAALLPGPGEVQDPVGPAIGDDTGDDSFTLLRLLDRQIEAPTTTSASYDVRYTLTSAGTAGSYNAGTGAATHANEWVAAGAIEPGVAGLYQVRVTVLSGVAPTTGTVDTWLSLGTTRTWTLSGTFSGAGAEALTSRLLIEIREAASAVLQESAVITLAAAFEPSPGGA